MTLAYLIQSHRSVEQLYRLVRTLRSGSPDAVIHVSHDRRGEQISLSALASAGATQVQLDEGGYGDFTHVQRYLDASQWLGTQPPVDWVTNLTGSDYPLRPLREIEADLAGSPVEGYLEYHDIFGPGCTWPRRRGVDRYLYQHRRVVRLSDTAARRLRPVMALNRVQPWLRLHVAYGLTVGFRHPLPPGRKSLRLYGGSAYSTLRWPVVADLLTLSRDRDLLSLFTRALSPEEAFAQTLLLNGTSHVLVNDSRRFYDFSMTRRNHPRTLGVDDVPAALASGADFGRKFDMSRDPAVLDQLDAALHRG